MRFLALLLGAVTLVTSSPGCAAAAAARNGGGDRPQVIQLHRFRKALWTIRVDYRGVEGDFLFDTGGGMTLLSAAFAKAVDCHYWGRTTGFNMFGERSDGAHCDGVKLTADRVALSAVDAGSIDFADRFSGDKAPDGLLALDAFDGKAITIDQAAGTLTIETPGSLARRVKGMTPLPFRLARECSSRCLDAFVGAPTREGLAWFTLDSGAGGVSLVAKHNARLFGMDPDVREQPLRFELAPGLPVDSPAVVADMIMDGNLGQPFLSKHLVTIDLAAGRLWVARR